jgi:hypothetical protein
MAGSSADFDGDEFRTNIRMVMELGAAPKSSEQVIFCFPKQLIYNRPTDDENTPFDPTATVTQSPRREVRVPCAVEWIDHEGETVPFGTVTATKLNITLLDEEYDQVKGCSYVIAGGDKYLYRRTAPPVGLYDVGVYQMVFVAENEL